MFRAQDEQLNQHDSRPTGAPGRLACILLWLLAAAPCITLVASDLRQLDGLRLSESQLIVGRDFVNLWSGGRLALGGGQSILYDSHTYLAWLESVFGPLDFYNYSYPPHSLLLALPFGAMPYAPALLLWTILSCALFIWAARPFIPQAMPIACAVITPAAIINIWEGQYGLVVGALWLLFYRYIDRAPGRGGAIAGLLTVKPHLGLLIALTLLTRRMTRPILIAGVVTIGLVAISAVAFGSDLWRIWLFETSRLQSHIMTSPGQHFYHFMMPSAYVALREAPAMVAVTAQAASAVAGLVLFWKARHAPASELAFIAASATAVIIPYIFNYDLTVASLGFAILLFSRWSALARWERTSLWCAFASPLLVIVFNPIATISLLLGLWVQVRHASGMIEGRPSQPTWHDGTTPPGPLS
ncbi:MAG: glycosyltransferase family 87 protein [Sphingobium sp.]